MKQAGPVGAVTPSDGYKNDPPLIEWRMAQVMRDMLGSTQIQTDIAQILRERKAAAEVVHV